VLIISRQQVENLLRKLNDPAKIDECRGEVAKMLEIESALLGKATDMLQPCCGSLEQVKGYLTSEVQILKDVLSALAESDLSRASSLLTEYTKCLEQLPR
jgi:hypothetical protein